MNEWERYREQVVDRLRAVVRARAKSVSKVEKKLAHGRGYVADALRGNKKLNLETILEVLEAVGMPPAEFFEQPTTGADRSDVAPIRDERMTVESLPASLRKAQPSVQAMALLLASRGLLDLDELEDMEHELKRTKRSARSAS